MRDGVGGGKDYFSSIHKLQPSLFCSLHGEDREAQRTREKIHSSEI
jgi:hypothetical protein